MEVSVKAITYTRFGAATDVLQLQDIAAVDPAAGEVQVEMRFSGVNPSDVKARAGARAGVTELAYPTIIPHSDGAGVIRAVGDGINRDRIGSRVWVWNAQWRRAFGTAAEFCTLPAQQAVPLGGDVSFETGASLGIPGLTATHTVFSGGDVAGKTVLVQGGAGTVGFLAVQLAKWGGARVIATANPGAHDRVLAAGADVVLDYAAPDLADQIRTAANGPVDRIIEVEFGVNAALDTEVIAENGTIVCYGSAKKMEPVLPFYPLMFKAVTLEMALIYILTDAQRSAAIARLTDALSAGALTCPVDRVFDLADCAKAHDMVAAGHRAGAVLVKTTP
jgi:NADPH:quinone reductase